jgi:alpha-beta hydrolase superfamily lysophospholipase
MNAVSRMVTKQPTPGGGGERFDMSHTSIHRVEADGVQVFYRTAGDTDAPVVLLLHGFPASSFMFRELIPRLAQE